MDCEVPLVGIRLEPILRRPLLLRRKEVFPPVASLPLLPNQAIQPREPPDSPVESPMVSGRERIVAVRAGVSVDRTACPP